MDSALRCPYKPFKLGLGGKQVTRYTREKCYGIFSCLSIIIIINNNNSLYFNSFCHSVQWQKKKKKNQEMNIMNISYISVDK